MSTTTAATIRDRQVAEVAFVGGRLDEVRRRLAGAPDEVRALFGEHLDRAERRGEDLSDEVVAWDGVEVGNQTRLDDLAAEVDTLEADLDAALAPDTDSYRAAMDRQLRVWRARSDRLNVQAELGSMELRDGLESAARRLDEVRGAVLVGITRAGDDISTVVVDMRRDVGAVITDVRRTIERTVDALVGDDD